MRRGRPAAPGELWFAIFGDAYFTVAARRVRHALAASGAPVWSYLFAFPSATRNPALGACHMLEIPFVFGTTDATADLAELVGVTRDVAELSRSLIAAWSAFAHDGAPGGIGGTQWPQWSAASGSTVVLDEGPIVVDDGERPELQTLESHLDPSAQGVRVKVALR